MKKLSIIEQAFTLVELLIVIALLGVIATIVIAAINPIEQANRARDAGYKADASQLESAIERYYTANNQFPWNVAGATTVESEFAFTSADNVAVGLCGTTGSTCKTAATQGVLITSLELQSSFLNKTWIGASSFAGTKVDGADPSTALWVGKAFGSSSSVYICYVPASNSNRQTLINLNKVLSVVNGFTTVSGGASAVGGLPAAGNCTKVNDPGWQSGSCVECVPE